MASPARAIRYVTPVATVVATILGVAACTTGSHSGPSADYLRTAQGLAEWQQREAAMRGNVRAAYEAYGRESTIDALQGYENAVRAYLDNGFSLYRAYREVHREPPDDLAASLSQRTAWLMDVADEYVKQGSIPVAEGLADEVVLRYSDLPVMSPAQRRAEALLLHFRYRQDY